MAFKQLGTAPSTANDTATKSYVDSLVLLSPMNMTLVTPKTANYTAAIQEIVPCDATTAAITVTLPATPADNSRVVVKKTDASANVVTVQCQGSDKFEASNGPATYELSIHGETITVHYRAGVWYVIEHSIPEAASKEYVDAAKNSFSATIGNGSSTSIAVTHNLGTLDVVVSVYVLATGKEIECDIAKTDGNTVTLGFVTAPALNALRCTVIGTAFGNGSPTPTSSVGITDATAIGRSLITAADAATARTAIGAGTSSLALGTTSDTAKAGDYQPSSTNISDSTAIGRALVTAADAAAARTAIGAGTSNLALGTTSSTAKAGDYQPSSTNISDSTTTGRSLITAADAAAARSTINAADYDQGRRIVTTYSISTAAIVVPASAIGAFVTLMGPGGGGGSGRRGAADTIRQGGGGGSSGAVIYQMWLPISWFGATCDITIGTRGSGGAAVTTDDTNGNAGTDGTSTVITSDAKNIYAAGGVAGTGGTTGAGGIGGLAGVYRPGTGAGASTSTDGTIRVSAPTIYELASSGGGSGGSISAANVAQRGGDGGSCWFHYGTVFGRFAGFVDGVTPGASTYTSLIPFSVGPGGGAASITTAAQAGGTSNAYGAGGAGGGASLNGNNSGAGSAGGTGWASIEWVLG